MIPLVFSVAKYTVPKKLDKLEKKVANKSAGTIFQATK